MRSSPNQIGGERKPRDSNPQAVIPPPVFKTGSSSSRLTSVTSCREPNRDTGGRNRTYDLLVQSQAQRPAATAPVRGNRVRRREAGSLRRRIRTSTTCSKGRRPTVSRSSVGMIESVSAARGNRTRVFGVEVRRRAVGPGPRQREERESNPQGSSLGRFRNGCRHPSAGPPSQLAFRTQHQRKDSNLHKAD